MNYVWLWATRGPFRRFSHLEKLDDFRTVRYRSAKSLCDFALRSTLTGPLTRCLRAVPTDGPCDPSEPRAPVHRFKHQSLCLALGARDWVSP